jgi:hypothetical protein
MSLGFADALSVPGCGLLPDVVFIGKGWLC